MLSKQQVSEYVDEFDAFQRQLEHDEETTVPASLDADDANLARLLASQGVMMSSVAPVMPRPEFTERLRHQLVQQATEQAHVVPRRTLAEWCRLWWDQTRVGSPRPRHANTTQLTLARACFGLAILFFGFIAAGVAYQRIFVAPSLDRETFINASSMTSIDQSQMSNGYTVTLRRAYADRNLVAVSWILRDPQGQFVADAKPSLLNPDTLTTITGVALPQNDYYRSDRSSSSIEIDPGVFGQEYYFSIVGITSPGDRLDLRLTVEFARPNGKTLSTPTTFSGWYSPTEDPVTGPVTFQFTVPLVEGTVVPIDAMRDVGPLQVAVHDIIIAPSGGFARVCVTTSQPIESWHATIKVAAGERLTNIVPESSGAYCGVVHLDQSMLQQGDHLLTITNVTWLSGGQREEQIVAWEVPYRVR